MAEQDAPGASRPDRDAEPVATGLSDALDDLEQLLGTAPDEESPSSDKDDTGPEPADATTDETARQQFLDAQYSIPLLDDVVVPGSPVAGPDESVELAGEEANEIGPSRHAEKTMATTRVGAQPEPELHHDDDSKNDGGHLDANEDDDGDPPHTDPHAAQLAARLASELEVIVDNRAQEAMRGALDEIKREVRRHIKIVLPEILDELAHKNSDRE